MVGIPGFEPGVCFGNFGICQIIFVQPMSRCKHWILTQFIHLETSDCSLHTFKKKGVRQWASLRYCTTQVLHHITPWTFKKGKSNSSFLAKAQSFSLKKKKKSQLREGTDRQNSSCYRCFLLAEMKQRGDERFVWARTSNGRKTNRTFAKNILVFVPLINTSKMSVLIMMTH